MGIMCRLSTQSPMTCIKDTVSAFRVLLDISFQKKKQKGLYKKKQELDYEPAYVEKETVGEFICKSDKKCEDAVNVLKQDK